MGEFRQEEVAYLNNGEIASVDSTDKKVEVIVKYVGDLDEVKSELGVDVELLDKNYAIIQVPIANLEKLEEYPNIIYVEVPQDVSLVQSVYNDNICIDSEVGITKDLTGEGVLVAVLDSGIDYKHLDFRNEDGTTRIEAIWDQGINTGKPPEGFLEGTLFTKEDINKALETDATIEHDDIIGHGTAVTGVACGNGRESEGKFVGIAPKSKILVVKLSAKGVGVAKTTDIMRALKFSYDYAIKIKAPLVVNISFGTSNGVRSGETLFETYVSEIAQSYVSNIVVAMGNEGNTGHHYANKLATGEVAEAEFNVQRGVSTFSIVLLKRFIDDMSMQIITPTGKATKIINLINTTETIRIDDYIMFVNAGSPRPYTIETGTYIEFQTVGEVFDDETWTIRIIANDVLDGRIDMWLPINELIGRKSFFNETALDTTLTIPATVKNVISVAGYNQNNNSLVGFSGRGNTILGEQKPDVTAPSVEVISTQSGGGYDAYTGTSFAAPVVSGAVALLLEWGIIQKNDTKLYGQRMNAYLQKGAKRPDITPVYPNTEIGYGILCVKGTLDLLRADRNTRNVRYIQDTKLDNIKNNSLRGEMMGNLQSTPILSKIKSENTVDFVLEYSDELIDLIDNTEYVHLEKIIDDDYIIVTVDSDKYLEALNNLFVPYRKSTSTLFSLCGVGALTASGITAVQNKDPLRLTGHGVLVGIIDTGIDYSNASFIDDIGKTRILSIWDMTQDGEAPNGFSFGKEITREEIDKALENDVKDLTVDTNGHGTFLASTIAGSKVSEAVLGAAPNAEIVAVKLKQAKNITKILNFVDKNIEDIYQSSDIIQGISYLVEKAKEVNKPIAICLGLSSNSGAHDGTTFLERYIEKISEMNKVFICSAVGNEALSRRHAEEQLTDGETKSLVLEVGDDKEVCIDIWLEYYEEVEITITTPNGAKTTVVPISESFRKTKKFTDQNSKIYIGYIRFYNAGSKNAIRIGLVTPEKGTWGLDIKGVKVIDGGLNIWLPSGNMISDTTYIVNAEIENTATIPSTARGVCAVGGYDHKNNSLYSSSGRGGDLNKGAIPTLIAPSVEVIGNYPLYTGTMTGTSVGSAIASGAGGLLLEWGIVEGNIPDMNTDVIKNILIKGCSRETSLAYPNTVTGFGKLNLIESFDKLL